MTCKKCQEFRSRGPVRACRNPLPTTSAGDGKPSASQALEKRSAGERIPFHDTFQDLEDAARRGCELCLLLFWSTQNGRWHFSLRTYNYDKLKSSQKALALSVSEDELSLWYLDGTDDDEALSWVKLTKSPPGQISYAIFDPLVGRSHGSLETIRKWRRDCELNHKKCNIWLHSVDTLVTASSRPSRPVYETILRMRPGTLIWLSMGVIFARDMKERFRIIGLWLLVYLGSYYLIEKYKRRIIEWRFKMRLPKSRVAHPTRLIDTQSSESPGIVRLVPYQDSMSRYAALSYRWGSQSHIATTTRENIQQRMQAIHRKSLPRTIEDAIVLCFDLDIRYLWVDALCIIQPEPSGYNSDWQDQSAIMGEIYQGAAITLSATGSSSHEDGFFLPKAPFDVMPRPCLFSVDGGCSTTYAVPAPPDWFDSVVRSPLQDRGWVLQERLFSTRLIHFTQHGLFWECHHLKASEFEPEGMERSEFGGHMPDDMDRDLTLTPIFESALTARKRGDMRHSFTKAVQDFSGRKLSVPTDRLTAISSLALRLKSSLRDDYFAGLWHENFFEQLLWHGLHSTLANRHRTSFSGNPRGTSWPLDIYIAPTWSWASVKGRIQKGFLGLCCWPKVVNFSVLVVPTTANTCGPVQPGARLRLVSLIRHKIRAVESPDPVDDYGRHELVYTPALFGQSGDDKDVSSTPVERRLHARVLFDVYEDRHREFSVVLVAGEAQERGDHREIFQDLGLGPDPNRQILTNSLFQGLLVVPTLSKMAGDTVYLRIGFVSATDPSFFQGCMEEKIVLF